MKRGRIKGRKEAGSYLYTPSTVALSLMYSLLFRTASHKMSLKKTQFFLRFFYKRETFVRPCKQCKYVSHTSRSILCVRVFHNFCIAVCDSRPFYTLTTTVNDTPPSSNREESNRFIYGRTFWTPIVILRELKRWASKFKQILGPMNFTG